MAARLALLVAAITSTGCATISTTASSRTLPGGTTLAVQQRVTDRQLEARWVQRGDSLAVELVEHRRCQTVSRVAVAREATDVRRADAAIYFEYGVAAVLLGLSALSFARPELFAVQQRNAEDRLYREEKTGYTLGGVFLGLGAAALGAGIYDSVRARDRVRRYESVEVQPGPAADCEEPMLPASQRRLELQLGAHRGRGVTDLEGRVHFTLPGPEMWPEAEPAASEAESAGLEGERERRPRAWRGTLRAGLARDMAIEVVLPYDATLATPRAGVTRTGAPGPGEPKAPLMRSQAGATGDASHGEPTRPLVTPAAP